MPGQVGARHLRQDRNQDFLAHNPNHPCIVINDFPKIAAKRAYPELYRETPVTLGSR